ncbi:MAG TPA: hypothetical protein VMT20_15615 [Terriglobia bacterium]|nr:hypothetical protein [Terriglobia bacterium]
MDLTPFQLERLEKLLRGGFRSVTIARYERLLAVERDGFIVLLDPNEGNLKPFSQPGYRIGDGIGMLVERDGGRAFVWHGESVPATPEMLETYQRFRAEVERALRSAPEGSERERE